MIITEKKHMVYKYWYVVFILNKQICNQYMKTIDIDSQNRWKTCAPYAMLEIGDQHESIFSVL